MQGDLPAGRQAAGEQMRVQVAGKQRGLEKEHRGRPDRSAAAKPGEDPLGDHWLDLEQQPGARKGRGGQQQVERVASTEARRTRSFGRGACRDSRQLARERQGLERGWRLAFRIRRKLRLAIEAVHEKPPGLRRATHGYL